MLWITFLTACQLTTNKKKQRRRTIMSANGKSMFCCWSNSSYVYTITIQKIELIVWITADIKPIMSKTIFFQKWLLLCRCLPPGELAWTFYYFYKWIRMEFAITKILRINSFLILFLLSELNNKSSFKKGC